MRFTVPIKHVDGDGYRISGKPGDRGRLGHPVALSVRVQSSVLGSSF